MPIDQTILNRMLVESPKDLSSLIAQLVGIDANITKWTEDDTLYKGMQAKDKSDLETRLAVKLTTLPTTQDAWQSVHTYSTESVVRPTVANGYVYYTSAGGTSGGSEPLWTTTPGDTFTDSGVTWECESLAISYGGSYNVSNISDWQIKMQPADVSIYQYQNTIATVKTFTLGNFSDGNKTYRNYVSGFSQSLNWVRIGIQGHGTYVTTIVNVSIAERDDTTQNIVGGTQQFFTFSGNARVDINPGIVQYTDWLEYDLDSSKTYFITMFIDSLYGTYSGTGNLYYRNGDYSLEANWGTSGTYIGQTRSIKTIEGWLSGPGQGWDGDTFIVQCVTDWNVVYPLIHDSVWGTIAMLSNLNAGRVIVNNRKTQITNRNPILPNYLTFTLYANIDGLGTISPSGEVSVNHGASQTFNITPDGGHSISRVEVDGTNVGTPTTYIFTNVTDNHIIKAFFT